MALDRYRRMRKFDRTPEPKGAKARHSHSGALRFVVQMHQASRLHFDFRIELGGVLLSWAVPRGPSLSPLDQRLALHVEDHPLEYGGFEGIIPPGNYGAGTVMVWDRGTWVERSSSTRAESEAAARRALDEGHLTMILRGEKLRGEFALVRLKKSREQNAWLLLKKRDEHARDRGVPPGWERSVKSGRTLERIAAQARAKGEVWIPGKGMAGKAFAEGRRSAVTPSRETKRAVALSAPMPHRVKPMLPAAARAAEGAPEGWITHALPEGVRAIAEIDGASARIHSKHLLPLERKHRDAAAALEKLGVRAILDGFVDGPTFHVIDLLYADGRDLRGEPLRARLRALEKLAIFGARVKLATKIQRGKELLARDPASHYVSGVSSHWLALPALRAPAAGRAPAPGKAAPVAAEATLHLTHLDKVLWPEGITKGDLIEYYRSVARYILPHLKGRPQSMHRHPEGIARKGFFHKDLTGYYPSWLRTERLYSESSAKTINFLLCEDERSLLYMANLACIELNPWLSRAGSLDHPDFAVIDLDPGERTAFATTVEVALEVKRVLDEVEVPAFVKTSGASGLHIYVPTGGRSDYGEAREFALAVCRLVNARLPEATSLERTPAKRRGKLYLDCYQNSRGQTVAAPYCVRPIAGAPVSTPLRWSEVKRGLDPKDFTIATMPRRLKRVGDLWAPILRARGDLRRALKALGARVEKGSEDSPWSKPPRKSTRSRRGR